ncbi:MAG TPA: HEAT repeat domain-containing protein [Myxococcota bacterium]|nr:HEAT repeat domain-containing protein [Myxococcota bacterium]
MKALAWILGGALALALAAALAIAGIALYYRDRAGDEVSFPQLYGFVANEIWNRIYCGVTGCEAELPEGMTSQLWDDTLLKSTPVAIDVDPHGRVYIAEADRIQGGVPDNRQHGYWLLDDLASRSVEDRAAYYEKWIAAGKFAEQPDFFTSRSDKLVRLADTDGDGRADERKELIAWSEPVSGLAAGVLTIDDEVWATAIPVLAKLVDADGDGVPERSEEIARGFGVKSSLVGHDLHGLALGPDGKLYFSLGDRGYHVVTREGNTLAPPLDPGRGAVFRVNRDGSNLEVFATGLRNPQELAFDDYGNLFTGENNSDAEDEARIAYITLGSDAGWAMPFQSMSGSYPRAAWVAEKLWRTQHDGQPAWIVPPIGHLGRGPAGFAHYPGTGLGDGYQGRFFMADYRYTPVVSQIWSFGVEPVGAGFRMVDAKPFVKQVVVSDFAFGFDGRLFVAHYEDIAKKQRLLVMENPEARNDPRVIETAKLAREGFGERDAAELARLLGHADQRIRLRAQYELARRGDAAPLREVARASSAPELARVHALWGLGQLGAGALAGLEDPALANALSPELRAQLARVAGDARAEPFAPLLLAWLRDESPRVRFFAAQSLGALALQEAVAPLFELLLENADRDVFLRHAAVYALQRIGDRDAVLARAGDGSRSVRLGVLLCLRAWGDARIARFLADVDRFLVVEAARAIHDVPIAGANGALAALLPKLEPVADDDVQTGFALHRRAIAANVAERGAENATALAGYAANAKHARALREAALEALAQFAKPAPRESVLGFYRPVPERAREVVFDALDRFGRALAQGDLGERALAIASDYGRLPLENAELVARANDARAEDEVRAAALRALAGRDGEDAHGAALDAARAALASDSPVLRAAARDVLVALAPQEGVSALLALGADAPLVERQRRYAALAAARNPRADAALAGALDALAEGTLPADEQLDALEAARARGGEALAAKLAAWEATLPSDDLIARNAFALAGGDAARGAGVFESDAAECMRCHGQGGHGAGAGPDLAGVSKRHDARGLLESVLLPQTQIAIGFGSVAVTLRDGSVVTGTQLEENGSEIVVSTGDGAPRRIALGEIAERTQPASAMPPTALGLAPRELRDLIAYLQTR